MNRHDAEKLLGGYATGTLTAQERSLLFAAALEHQELFDALADEEALREVLADPEARLRLLRDLPEPRRTPAFWEWLRRPVAIGLAASLAGAALVGVALWRNAQPDRAQLPVVAEVRPPKAPEPSGSATESQPVPKVRPPAAAPPLAAPPRKQAPLPPAVPSGVGETAGVIGGVPGPGFDRPAPAPAARAEDRTVVVPERAAGSLRTMAPPRADTARLRASAEALSDAPGAGLQTLQLEAPPVPTHVLQLHDDGSASLTVTSPAGGYIYVLRRTAAGTEVVPARRSVAGPTGTTRAEFEFPVTGVSAIDLYVLRQAAPVPADLPSSPSPAGAYQRIYPLPETIRP